LLDLELNIEGSEEDENLEMPTYEEIEESIKKLKNKRTPGKDNIIAEMIKYGVKKRCPKPGKLVLSAPYSKKVINLTATTIEALHYWI
jgi:hypothetical protein